MGIGDKLQTLIKEKQTNVNELAIRANVSPSTLYSIIKRNNTKVDIDALIRICRVLGVPVEYFSDEQTGEPIWYLDPETAALAQVIKDSPDLRVMLDASKNLSYEDLKMVSNVIQHLKKKERGEDD